MTWIDTPESSNILRFSYDESMRVLRVEFKSGVSYDYFDIPVGVLEGFKMAPSKGQFLAAQIKGNFRYARV